MSEIANFKREFQPRISTGPGADAPPVFNRPKLLHTVLDYFIASGRRDMPGPWRFDCVTAIQVAVRSMATRHAASHVTNRAPSF